MKQRRILVVAGSDSSGGASVTESKLQLHSQKLTLTFSGLEADQKVIAAHLCYAMTATTALTVQNTLGVSGIHHVPPDFVSKQIDACISDIGVDVVKIGMLASAETVEVVATALERHNYPTVVVDPVMVSTSGAQLLPEEAVSILRTRLLPLTTVLTPNIPEARLLLQNANIDVPKTTKLDDVVGLAKGLHTLGPRFILVKGGHLAFAKTDSSSHHPDQDSNVVDVLFDGHEVTLYETKYIRSKNTHGTGCSLACKYQKRGLLLSSTSISYVHPVLCAIPHLTMQIEHDCNSSTHMGIACGNKYLAMPT